MRLWHQSLLNKIPNNQLKGQHRECCALRGNGWGKKHRTVNYVFRHNPYTLFLYHQEVMFEIGRRNKKKAMNYSINKKWFDPYYRGVKCDRWKLETFDDWERDAEHDNYRAHWIYYEEHDELYLNECISNLHKKGIVL